jgi:hypothetical protein
VIPHTNDTHANLHWSWHILIAAAVLLIGTAALLYNLQSTAIDRARRHLLATTCAMTGITCLVSWSLRRVLSRDWHTALTRHVHGAAPRARDITPPFPPRLQTGLWLVLAVWMAWVIKSLILDDRLAANLTLENGLLQDITVLCYGASAFLFARLVLRALHPHELSGFQRWWFLILGLGCLVVAGEEINWGQSLIQYETPDFLASTNVQQEVSLHNIELPGLPGRHWSNVVLWGISLLGGVVIPTSLMVSPQIRRLIRIAEIPVPPWVSQGYFLAAALIPRDGDMLGRLSRDNIPSELREVTIAMAMLIWAWVFWRQQVIRPADSEDRTLRGGGSGEDCSGRDIANKLVSTAGCTGIRGVSAT